MTVAKSLPHLWQKVRKLLIPKLFLSYSCILWKNNIRYGIWSLCSWLSGSKERRNKVCRGGRLTIIDTFIAKKVDAYWDRFYGNSVDKLIDALRNILICRSFGSQTNPQISKCQHPILSFS